jgi:hypothetical protein
MFILCIRVFCFVCNICVSSLYAYFLLYYLRLNLRKFGFKFKTKFEKNLFLILKIINRCGCPRVNRGQPQRLMGPQWLISH